MNQKKVCSSLHKGQQKMKSCQIPATTCLDEQCSHRDLWLVAKFWTCSKWITGCWDSSTQSAQLAVVRSHKWPHRRCSFSDRITTIQSLVWTGLYKANSSTIFGDHWGIGSRTTFHTINIYNFATEIQNNASHFIQLNVQCEKNEFSRKHSILLACAVFSSPLYHYPV